MNEFNKFQFNTLQNAHLFNNQIEALIFKFCKENELILPNNFNRSHYEFYTINSPVAFIEYSIVFFAREKRPADLLREQIEYQIKQLQK